MADYKLTKLDPTSLSYIERVVSVAKIAGIDSVIIGNGMVRGMDEDQTVVILDTNNVPSLPMDTSIGLNRVSTFQSRYEISKSASGFSIDAYVDDGDADNPFIRSLTLKGKGTKIDFRCAAPASIKAPKTLNDTVTHSSCFNVEAVQMIVKGQSAMGADEMALRGSTDGVVLEIRDNGGDMLTYDITKDVRQEHSDASTDFYHRYPIKAVIPLIKQNPDGKFLLSKRGMLYVSVNNINVVILPKA